MFQTIKTILTALVSLSGDSENDMVDMSLDDSESVEEDEEDDSKEGNKSYLVKDVDLEAIKVECVEGDKPGSTWLLFVFCISNYNALKTYTYK